MNGFKYTDEKISPGQILVAIPSMVIGVGILLLPKELAEVTVAADGWIPLIIAGVAAVFLTWAAAKFAAGFPNQSFITYASTLATKPVATILTALFAVSFFGISAFTVRQIATIANHYLFDQTPIEVIALSFLLLLVYAVAGSRAGLFRLNMLFLPIVLFIAFVISGFNIGLVETRNLLPIFQTDISGYMQGIQFSITSYMGFSILLFYTAFVDDPKKVPKMAALGMCIPIGLYVLLFILTVGVFGNVVTTQLLYPVIELAKVVELPGEFFERFESIYFVIWIMTIFNTGAMALDVSVLTVHSIFKKAKKVKILISITPVIFTIAMLPQDVNEIDLFAVIISYSGLLYFLFVLLLLIILKKVRGVK